MHNLLSTRLFNPKQHHNKAKSFPAEGSVRPYFKSSTWKQPKSNTASPTKSRSAQTSSLQLSKTSTNSSSSTGTVMSYEELDCFRSMRGTSIDSTQSLGSAMSSDVVELTDRLRTVKHAGERHKKVFDGAGQGYSILVTHEEVRVCHVDEKGEYHYKHLPLPAPRPAGSLSRRNSTAGSSNEGSANSSRATSTERKSDKTKKAARRQVVRDQNGRTLVDITPTSVTVFHDGGVWRCHRMLGKIWDSDYASHLTARLPRPWSRRPSESKKAFDSTSALDDDELARNGWSHDQSAVDDGDEEPVELLLCSNTPGEKGTAPRAFKSFYHDL